MAERPTSDEEGGDGKVIGRIHITHHIEWNGNNKIPCTILKVTWVTRNLPHKLDQLKKKSTV